MFPDSSGSLVSHRFSQRSAPCSGEVASFQGGSDQAPLPWKSFNNVERRRVQQMSIFSVTSSMRWSHELVTRHRWLRAHTQD